MGNTLGHLFRVTTFGESHGVALGCVIDGCPPKIPLSEKDVQRELDRRKPGQSAITTSRREGDKVKILSGVFEGKTLGTPIAMVVYNSDQRSGDYEKFKNVFRPGHADFVWEMKYGFRDYRGGGRSSGRETVSRVMAGAVGKKILAHALPKFKLYAYAKQIGPILGKKIDVNFIEKNLVRAADPLQAKKMEAYILKAKEDGDSVGGVVEIMVKGIPLGLGEPVFDKLNADLAKALVSIPTVKAVEFGAGFSVALKKGSEQNDPFTVRGGKIAILKNDAGGISGGISTGEDLIIRVTVKPPSSIMKTQRTATKQKTKVNIQVTGRHDPCIIPRFIPVAESMVTLVLADHYLRYRAIKF
jgi:chorismate synthase